MFSLQSRLKRSKLRGTHTHTHTSFTFTEQKSEELCLYPITHTHTHIHTQSVCSEIYCLHSEKKKCKPEVDEEWSFCNIALFCSMCV